MHTRADLQAFVDLPYRLYCHDLVWVPPLRDEQMSQYDPARNPMLDHCKTTLFLAEDAGKIVGRVSAFIDHLALDAWKEPIGLFGSYECANDPAASRLLLDAARQWLRGQGMRAMRGPWSFASQEWGAVLEGYTSSPVVMAPYNPPYYNDQLAAYGLSKVKDLVVYYIDDREGYQIPERIIRLTDLVQKRFKVHVRPLNMDRLDEDVAAMARDMKQLVHPKAILIAEDAAGKPIGLVIAGGLVPPAITNKLLPDDFDEDALSAPPVEFPIKNLLPRAKVQLPVRDGYHHLASHHLALQVRIGVVFA